MPDTTSQSKVTYGMRVLLSKLAWTVPIVQPNDVRKANLYKSISANNVIPVSFRMRQCETFSLPQARSTVWRLGVSSAPENLDGYWLDCKRTRVVIRKETLPCHSDFVKEQYAGVYKSFYDFASRYYGIDNLLAGSGVSPATFK